MTARFRVDASTAAVESAVGPAYPLKIMMTSKKSGNAMSQQPEAFGLDRLHTPIGTALLVSDADGVLRALDWEEYEARMRDLLRLQYGAVVLQQARAPAETRAALTGYFEGGLDRLNEIRWQVAGTPFQRKVWNALPRIPPGSTLSYGALALQIGMPKAVRAVGHANGANPLSVVVPCHRLMAPTVR